MKHAACVIALIATLGAAGSAWAAPQAFTPEEPTSHPAQAAGISLAAAAANIIYIPARLAVTLITAELGGLTGWLTAGSRPSAHAVWRLTDGQAVLTPAILEGRERLRFGQ